MIYSRALRGALLLVVSMAPTRAQAVTFDDAATPGVIFGSGNANGFFTVDRRGGIELGLRGKLRFNASGAPENTFNSNGDGTYTFNAGVAPVGASPPSWQAATTPEWNVEWSINTNFDATSGLLLNDLTYRIELDFDPGSGTSFLAWNHVSSPTADIPFTPPFNPGFYDHALGTNASVAPGTVATDAAGYAALLTTNNVAQNSWSYEFFNEAPFAGFDPSEPGVYDVRLTAFDGTGALAAQTSIQILVACVTDGDCDDGVVCNGAEVCDLSGACLAGTPIVCDDGLFCNGVEACDLTGACLAGTPVVCDDGVACTLDFCNETNDSCGIIASDFNCNDGQFCNGLETCDAVLGCQAGTAVDCTDSVACTIDACNEATDACDNTASDLQCDNGVFCDGVETCDAVLSCQAGTLVLCDDGIACTSDSCDATTDACTATPNHVACDNGLFCDGAEVCNTTLGCQRGPAVVCDDGVSCTSDSCDEAADTCIATPLDSNCDNLLFCDGVETCDAVLGCQAGTPVVCSDGVSCTGDVCDETLDTCVSSPDNNACDDGLFCNGMETCDVGGGCQPGAPPDCNDAVGCTVDACNELTDSCDNTPTPALCDNGLFCDGAELCDAVLGCQAGAAVTCDDSVSCTADSCNEATDGCNNSPDDTLCDNGLFCDGVEACDTVAGCQAGVAPDCNDAIGCTADTCNETTDACANTPADSACDDGLFCNGAEVCNPTLNCVAGTPPNCNDGVGCTRDSCSEVVGACVSTPDDTICGDGLFCNGSETCDATLDCQNGSAPNCNDGVACTIDSCNETTDSCVNSPDSSLCGDGLFCNGVEVCNPTSDCQPGTAVLCDDAIACTIDACSEATDSCVNTPNNSACDDAQFCNGTEACDTAFDCRAGTSVVCDDGIACTVDACDEAADACTNTTADALCDDGAFCNGPETCHPVLDCRPGAPPNCVDGVGCTVDACDETADACTNTTSDTLCDDGQFCNGSETCNAVLDCQIGTPVNCDDGVGCTNDSCNETSNACVNTTNDGLCDDGTFCNGAETCNAISDCQGGPPPTCNDGVPCTVDSCNAASDSCINTPDPTLCDDGQFCNGTEICSLTGGCQPGSLLNCSDGVSCTIDTCNESIDECVSTPSDPLCDNGFFCDGAETCDRIAGCQSSPPPNCDDGVDCTIDGCDEPSSSCLNEPADVLCSDGVLCNGTEFCEPLLGCQDGTDIACDDGVLCTVESCNDAGSCVSTPDDALCDDGLFCSGTETCDSFEGCTDGEPIDCNDGVTCTQDLCNDDTDACDNIPDDVVCDNGAFCDGVEVCDPIFDCESGPRVDCSGVTSGCAAGFCNEVSDQCMTIPDDSLCGDGVFCNGAEICVGGTCAAGPLPNCAALDSDCGTGSCDETIRGCVIAAQNEGAPCDDGDACTPADVCVAGTCRAGGTTCGNGVLDVACGESCDPPSLEICDNLMDDDGDTLIDCVDPDCDASGPPTCGAGCTEVTACKTIAQDPAKIRFRGGGQDQLTLRGRVAIEPARIDPAGVGLVVLLSNSAGAIYRGELFAGDLLDKGKGRYKFRDRAASEGLGTRGGLTGVSVKIKRLGGQWVYMFRIKAFADLSNATEPQMTLQVSGVDNVATLSSTWTQRRNGWTLGGSG